MLKTSIKLFLLTITVMSMLTLAALAESPAEEVCTFDNLSISYPADWIRKDNSLGIFLEKDEGFFQITTAVFPEGYTMEASEMIESGAITAVMQGQESEKIQYTSEPQIVSINGKDYVTLSVMNDGTPLIQYIGFKDHIMLVIVVKGETCQAAAPDILASLRWAEEGAISSDAASGEYNVNRLINRENAEGKQELVGLISDPVPAVFSDFAPMFAGSMAVLNSSIKEEQINLGRCYYSDSRYVYAWHYVDSNILVYVQSTSNDAQIGEIVITASTSVDKIQAARMITDLLIASYGSLSSIHSFAYDRLFALDDTGIPYDGPELPYWTENGWTIVFEQNEYNYLCRISYTGELEPLQEPPIITDNFIALPPAFREGLTVDGFCERFNWICKIMKMSELRLSEPDNDNGRSRAGIFENVGTLLLRFENPDHPEWITGVILGAFNDDTAVLWAGCIAAMYAFSNADENDLQSLILLGGGSGSWPSLAKMKPYICLNNTVLQAFIINGRPMAAIFGTGT